MARGAQLKNYFNKKALTASELKYAAKHYVQDTGVDNNMTDFFDAIKKYAESHPEIWKKMAKWGTEISAALSVPLYLNK